MKLKLVLATALVVAAAAVVVAFSSDDTFHGISVKTPFDPSLHGKGAKTAGTQIIYHGGPVMHPVSVYYIYYGAVSSSVQTIMNDFLHSALPSCQPPRYWESLLKRVASLRSVPETLAQPSA